MSNKKQIFEWEIPEKDVQYGIPVGFKVELSQNPNFYPITKTYSTFFENETFRTQFFYSLDNKDTWVEYPKDEIGVEFYQPFWMKLEIYQSDTNFIIGNAKGVLYKINSNCNEIIEEYNFDLERNYSLALNKNISFLSGQNNTLYGFDFKNEIKPYKNSINLKDNPLDVVIDTSRNSFWQVNQTNVSLKNLFGDEIFSIDFPFGKIDVEQSSSSSSSSSTSSSSSSSSFSSSSSSVGKSSSSSSSVGKSSSSSSSSSVGTSSSSSMGTSSSSSSLGTSSSSSLGSSSSSSSLGTSSSSSLGTSSSSSLGSSSSSSSAGTSSSSSLGPSSSSSSSSVGTSSSSSYIQNWSSSSKTSESSNSSNSSESSFGCDSVYTLSGWPTSFYFEIPTSPEDPPSFVDISEDMNGNYAFEDYYNDQKRYYHQLHGSKIQMRWDGSKWIIYDNINSYILYYNQNGDCPDQGTWFAFGSNPEFTGTIS
jgi:hypothetical protein